MNNAVFHLNKYIMLHAEYDERSFDVDGESCLRTCSRHISAPSLNLIAMKSKSPALGPSQLPWVRPVRTTEPSAAAATAPYRLSCPFVPSCDGVVLVPHRAQKRETENERDRERQRERQREREREAAVSISHFF